MADGYICRLLLPPNAAIREITSQVCSTKRAAKRNASLLACKELYEKRCLNEYLLPQEPTVDIPQEEESTDSHQYGKNTSN